MKTNTFTVVFSRLNEAKTRKKLLPVLVLSVHYKQSYVMNMIDRAMTYKRRKKHQKNQPVKSYVIAFYKIMIVVCSTFSGK